MYQRGLYSGFWNRRQLCFALLIIQCRFFKNQEILLEVSIQLKDEEKKIQTQFRFRINNEIFHDYFLSKIQKKCSI